MFGLFNFGDNSGTQLEGDGSHGTHCAGVIGADKSNGQGIAGARLALDHRVDAARRRSA